MSVISAPPADAGGITTSDVCAVIISYNPQIDMLDRVVDSVIAQVGRLLLFDNATPDPAVAAHLGKVEQRAVEVIRSPTNVGLGAAMNQAADYAKRLGFTYLLLLDQDSLPDAGMVATLKQALQDLQRSTPVAAVGPQFRDRRSGYVAPFIRVAFPFSRKLLGGAGQRVACDFLISSGTLLPIASLALVGGMDEALFIDNVDLEWCFRAKYRGLGLYGVCDAQMSHSIGDSLRASRFKRSGIMVHQPLRLYYIMRNRVLLYRRKETPIAWIAQDIPRLILKFFGTGACIAPRRAYLHAMSRGLYDGVRGAAGPLRP